MKLNLTNIKKIKSNTENELTKRVCNYVINEWNNYTDKKSIFTDILNYGCQSGIVSELVYYSQTTAFYKKYQDEINELLYEFQSSTGIYDLKNLFGKKWDEQDPLVIEDYNQNLLAWFGFEETLRYIGYEFEELQECI